MLSPSLTQTMAAQHAAQPEMQHFPQALRILYKFSLHFNQQAQGIPA
jgi:hypothetical protein